MMDKRLNRALPAGLLAPWHPLLPVPASFSSEKAVFGFREQDDGSGVGRKCSASTEFSDGILWVPSVGCHFPC